MGIWTNTNWDIAIQKETVYECFENIAKKAKQKAEMEIAAARKEAEQRKVKRQLAGSEV